MTNKATQLASKLIRNFDDSKKEKQVRDPLYETLSATLAKGTAAQKLGASIDVVPAGKRSCPYHFHHAQEEMFIILDGIGTLRVAGELLPVKAGDIVFIPAGPECPHQLINSSSADLKYLAIGTRETPEIVEYSDSGKYFATARTTDNLFRAINKLEENFDYWDGEP